MNEHWLPVPGFAGYEVSDQGRVRSLERVVKSRWGTPKPLRGRILQQPLLGRYPSVCLYKSGQAVRKPVHHLVLLAFAGKRPAGMFGCHRDDDPTNNCLQNLYWGTPKQNARDMVNNGACRKTQITHCPHGHEYTEENTYIVANSGHRQCRTCIKNRGQAKKTRPHSSERTHCPQGHPYMGENLIINSQGRRTCRECGRARAREYQQRKRLSRSAVTT